MDLSSLQEKLDYVFKNKNLLEIAITHSSYSNEKKESGLLNNERLEFLGDSVLSLAISNHIYKKYPDLPEGEMTRARAAIVCETSLREVASELGISDYLKLGKGEEASGGRTRSSILADATEAIIAAIYIDGGFEPAENFIISNMKNIIEEAIIGKGIIDYKTKLQELLQQNGDVKILYNVLESSGPDHDKHFTIEVTCDDKKLGTGKGHSKKEAEQDAAKNALHNKKIM